MKNLVQPDNTNGSNSPVAPYSFNNGAYMNLNQRENQNTLQNKNVNNANRTQNLMNVNKNNNNNRNNNNNNNNRNTNRKETASDIANTNTIESFSNMETYINYLQKNNELLRQQLEILQNNTPKTEDRSSKMYIFDLLLYIVSGIFIIYILDLFVKMLMKNKK